jgi:hypothetical protein
MLLRSHSWTPTQRLLIASAIVLALVSFGALVYIYERYHRGPTDSVFFGTWQIEDGCIDCTHLITLEPNHNAVGFGDYMGREGILDYRGRWYAGGELLVIHYNTPEESQSIIMADSRHHTRRDSSAVGRDRNSPNTLRPNATLSI